MKYQKKGNNERVGNNYKYQAKAGAMGTPKHSIQTENEKPT